MIGLVLVTHGNLALEFISAMQHVVGPQEQVAGVCIGPEDDMEMRRNEILEKINSVNTGEGVVLLTDMFGGTPSNLALSMMDRANVEILAGINLPMLIKIASLLHDIGKIGIKDSVLQKEGRLTPKEYEHIKEHVR